MRLIALLVVSSSLVQGSLGNANGVEHAQQEKAEDKDAQAEDAETEEDEDSHPAHGAGGWSGFYKHAHDHLPFEDLKPSEMNHIDPVMLPGIYHILQFALVAIASWQVGLAVKPFQLPVISGYLLCGMLAGPHMLSLLEHDSVKSLRIVDQLTLTSIAFLAGAELHYTTYKPYMKKIAIMISVLVSITFVAVFFTVILFSSWIPFEKGMNSSSKFAVALLVSTVLMARSPASAIAVIKETGAKGPFTTTCLGVSIVLDIVLIVVFSVNMNLASTLINGTPFNMNLLVLPFVKIAFSGFVGLFIGIAMDCLLGSRLGQSRFNALLLTSGMVPFVLNSLLGHHLHAEPLLTCVAAGLYITNYGDKAQVFHSISERMLPMINLFFFTSAGAELALSNMLEPIVVLIGFFLFLIRLASLFAGGYVGSYLSARPEKERRLAWMGYITQAGVGMGLAKDVADAFPAWGGGFASLMISVMFVNQVTGPILFRKALRLLEESPAGPVATPAMEEVAVEMGKRVTV